MIRTFELSATPLPPADSNAKLPVGPTDLRDPGGLRFVAEWLEHVAAGRLAGSAEPNAQARAIVLANERIICGRQRTFPD
jgi:hypothetical protein